MRKAVVILASAVPLPANPRPKQVDTPAAAPVTAASPHRPVYLLGPAYAGQTPKATTIGNTAPATLAQLSGQSWPVLSDQRVDRGMGGKRGRDNLIRVSQKGQVPASVRRNVCHVRFGVWFQRIV